MKKETLWSTVALLVVSISYMAGWATGKSGVGRETDPPSAAIGAVVEKNEGGIGTTALSTYAGNGWRVISETSDELIMRRDAQTSPPPAEKSASPEAPFNSGETAYIIGEQDGFVAVFFDTPEGLYLKTLTETPLSSLPYAERERLEAGIRVSGDDELHKVMEDYGS